MPLETKRLRTAGGQPSGSAQTMLCSAARITSLEATCGSNLCALQMSLLEPLQVNKRDTCLSAT